MTGPNSDLATHERDIAVFIRAASATEEAAKLDAQWRAAAAAFTKLAASRNAPDHGAVDWMDSVRSIESGCARLGKPIFRS
jgi:hypothetical protein